MTTFSRIRDLLLVLILVAAGAALAQEDVSTVGGEEFVAVGGIEVTGTEPIDAETEEVDVAVETGAIVFTAETPGEQHPNVDLVGPDDYFQHLEVSDEDEQVVDGLLPGVYSVAATDDGLQLAHTLVEVTPGQATLVNIALNDAAAQIDAEALAAGDRFVYPDEAFEVGEPEVFENDEFGAVAVETDNDDATFVITGPDGYSEEFEGTFTAEDLLPGLYVIAGTDDGSGIATSKFRVDVATATRLVPVFDVFAQTEVVERDVAGGGEAAEESAVEQAGDEPVDEEPAADEAAEDDPIEIDVEDEGDSQQQ
ncbi:MAG TPA: hypothetical protein VF168_00725 [Trueperaceae bacterium]